MAEVFKDFLEYFHFFQHLTTNQREIIFATLPLKEQERMEASCLSGGWQDLIVNNELHNLVEVIKIKHSFDPVEARCKVLKNKSVYLKSSIWQVILETFNDYNPKDTRFVIGGIKGVVVNDDTVLLIKTGEGA